MSDADREVVDAVVSAEHDGMRVDRYVSEALELFPRSQLKTRAAEIRIDGHPAKLSRTVHEGHHVEVEFGPLPLPDLEPEPIPLSIIFENSHVLVVDKPQGMVVHPAQGNYSGTLANAVLHHTTALEEAGFDESDLRPGIVHRLDKDTSGVIVVAKTVAAHEVLSSQFHDREVEKRYIAVTKGVPSPRRGEISGFIRRDPHNRKRFTHDEYEGKPASTRYAVLRALEDHAVVVLAPHTGRTHQLRVHMRHLDCPILGDPVYARHSKRFPQATLMLHALSLRLRLPGDDVPRTFVARLPGRFAEVICELIGSVEV
jgi:23S rRNA pseudouridine1911/1915/1917 synthase